MPVPQASHWPAGAHSAGDIPRRSQLRRGMRVLRNSRALASMLPAFLLTGIASLVTSAVGSIFGSGPAPAFFSAWMEAWLVSWPIAFPFVYLIGRPLVRLAMRRLSP